MRLPDLRQEFAQRKRHGQMHDACMVRYVDLVRSVASADEQTFLLHCLRQQLSVRALLSFCQFFHSCLTVFCHRVFALLAMQPPVIGIACDSESDEVANAITPFHGELLNSNQGRARVGVLQECPVFRVPKRAKTSLVATNGEKPAFGTASRVYNTVYNRQRHE